MSKRRSAKEMEDKYVWKPGDITVTPPPEEPAPKKKPKKEKSK